MANYQKLTDQSPMPWGKYRGRSLGNIPASYFIWLYEEWGLKNSGEMHRPLREYVEDNMKALKLENKAGR